MSAVRLDKYLQSVGIVPRRSRAKQACDEGLIEIDGRIAKSSSTVAAGQHITVRIGMKESVFEVLDVPQRPVPRPERDRYRKLIAEKRVDPDRWS